MAVRAIEPKHAEVGGDRLNSAWLTNKQYYTYNLVVAASKIKICLVDDHPVMLRGLALILADNPRFDVVAAFRDGRETLAHFPSMPAFDVAVIDIMMPGIDGFEVIERVSSSFPEAKILAYTACGDREIMRKALSCGAVGFVPKSSDIKVLAEAIERVYSEAVYYCSESLKTISMDFRNLHDPSLTGREKEILELLKRGLSNQEIAKNLYVSYSTARFHIKNIYRKLGVSGRSQLSD